MISSKMTSYLLILLIGAASVTAELDDIVDDIEAEEGDARTVFTSGGNYYIALNTTYLLYYAIIAGSLLLAGLALSSLFGGGAAETESAGYGQQYGQQQQGYQGQQRQKRNAFDQNFTNQLYLLAEAFQKYEIEETGCQLYVACESSNVSKHQKNGRLAKLVYEVMSNLQQSQNEDLYKDDQYMKDLMSAFKIGSIGTDCSKFRQMCRTEKVF